MHFFFFASLSLSPQLLFRTVYENPQIIVHKGGNGIVGVGLVVWGGRALGVSEV